MSYLHNAMMAQLLQERGIIQGLPYQENLQHLPSRDVLVNYHGLRTAINGEVGSAMRPHQRSLRVARQHVEKGIAHIGVAVVYPETLRHQPWSALKLALPQTELAVATVTEAQETAFVRGTVDHVEETLRQAFEQLTREDVVSMAAKLLDKGIEAFAQSTANKPHLVARLSFKLGIPEQLSAPLSARQAARLPLEQRAAICRISGLVLINAMISQALLAKHDDRVCALPPMRQQPCLKTALVDHWDFIMDNINYYSLFNLATHLLDNLTPSPDVTIALENLLTIAHRIVSEQGLALRHDLMGRVYHRLLGEAKYLGIFYTTIPAASLLLKLALNTPYAWHDLEALETLKIADLSCGTGTLLMAAADAVTDNYVSASAHMGQTPDNHHLHKALLEKMLHGYDVLPSAVHLTASTLALRAPRITFNKMHLFSLPLGGQEHRLGSVEFLQGNQVTVPADMFAPQVKIKRLGSGPEEEVMFAELPPLDLCVINPPFTRSVGGNLLFGSVPDKERKPMQRKLKELVRQPGVQANTIAGLGSVFVAAADKHLKVGGRLALVLPKALISGVAWKTTRDLLGERYRVEYLISSHDPKRWNFSESTELSEVLLVATKLAAADPIPSKKETSYLSAATLTENAPQPMPVSPLANQTLARTTPHAWSEKPAATGDNVTVVNLWHNPQNSFEALALAFALINNDTVPQIADHQPPVSVTIGERKIAEAIRLPWAVLKDEADWMLPCAFAQAEITRTAYHLERGQLWLPYIGLSGSVPLRPLGQFGTLGPDRRDIHDAYHLADGLSDYPAFWGQKSSYSTLNQTPNQYLQPVTAAKKGRTWRDPASMWPKAGRLLLLERLRLNTQRVIAVRLSEPVLSNMWWEFSYRGIQPLEAAEKALALWLNSTLGLLMLLSHRQETQGAWVAFKKPILMALPVLDLESLSADQLADLAFGYDEIADESMFPFPELHIDPVRAEIDRHLSQTLNLPDLAPLRDMLAHEPVVCAQPLS